MVLQIPIGVFINLCLKAPAVRHLFNIVVGIFLQVYMFRWQVGHIFLMAYVSYAIMMFAPRATQHKYNVAWLFGYMLYQHISAMLHEYGGYNMDVTTHTMLEVTKLWGLAFAFKDGMAAKNELSDAQ